VQVLKAEQNIHALARAQRQRVEDLKQMVLDHEADLPRIRTKLDSMAKLTNDVRSSCHYFIAALFCSNNLVPSTYRRWTAPMR
jgi:hypothetical protein